MEDSPLNNLFVDRGVRDENLLAELLQPYIGLYREEVEVIPMEAWHGLNLTQKLLTFMLGRKALKWMEIVDRESMTSAELIEATGLNPNSVRPTLSKLVDQRLVKYDKDAGIYVIPDHVLIQIKQLLP